MKTTARTIIILDILFILFAGFMLFGSMMRPLFHFSLFHAFMLVFVIIAILKINGLKKFSRTTPAQASHDLVEDPGNEVPKTGLPGFLKALMLFQVIVALLSVIRFFFIFPSHLLTAVGSIFTLLLPLVFILSSIFTLKLLMKDRKLQA